MAGYLKTRVGEEVSLLPSQSYYQSIYHFLRLEDPTSLLAPSISIPDTILFVKGKAMKWYFTCKAGTVKLRRRHKMTPQHILKAFVSKRQRFSCDIVASAFKWGNSTDDPPTVQYFTEDTLRNFLEEMMTNCSSDKHYLLQKFIVSDHMEHNSVTQVCWKMGDDPVILTRTNKSSLTNFRLNPTERAVTFDGPDLCCVPHVVPFGQSYGKLKALTEEIVAIMESSQKGLEMKYFVKAITLYFKLTDGEQHLLWCDEVKLGRKYDKASTAANKDPAGLLSLYIDHADDSSEQMMMTRRSMHTKGNSAGSEDGAIRLFSATSKRRTRRRDADKPCDENEEDNEDKPLTYYLPTIKSQLSARVVDNYTERTKAFAKMYLSTTEPSTERDRSGISTQASIVSNGSSLKPSVSGLTFPPITAAIAHNRSPKRVRDDLALKILGRLEGQKGDETTAAEADEVREALSFDSNGAVNGAERGPLSFVTMKDIRRAIEDEAYDRTNKWGERFEPPPFDSRAGVYGEISIAPYPPAYRVSVGEFGGRSPYMRGEDFVFFSARGDNGEIEHERERIRPRRLRTAAAVKKAEIVQEETPVVREEERTVSEETEQESGSAMPTEPVSLIEEVVGGSVPALEMEGISQQQEG